MVYCFLDMPHYALIFLMADYYPYTITKIIESAVTVMT